MLVKRLPIVLFCLIKALEAAVPPLSNLDSFVDTTTHEVAVARLNDQMAQLEIKVSRVNTNDTEPLLSFFEISEQMEKLIRAISALDTKAAVITIEEDLVQILKSNITLHDIAPTICSLPIEATKLVLAALEVKAYTLLNLLQIVYIWRDEHQYHWFMALIEGEPWRNKELKNDLALAKLDWRSNLRAICEADSGALAAATRNSVPSGDALESFDKELLLLCAEYDSIRVFESTKLDPIRLKEHIELLAKNSAVKLLQLYQNHTKIPHLHLEELPFPEKLPINADDLEFLMKNGYNCFPMSKLMGEFCKEGRLDLLEYLQKVNSMLIPREEELKYAAENNFVDILDWARRLNKYYDTFSGPFSVCKALIVNHHFDTLFWWMDINEINLYERKIKVIVKLGALNVLQWVEKNRKIGEYLQKVANSAALYRHLPILEWLYEEFGLLPNVLHLGHATGEMLDWIKSKSHHLQDPNPARRAGYDYYTMSYENLIHHGPSNFELLQWVSKNSPLPMLEMKKEDIALCVESKEIMLWLYEKLKICPAKMDWAYTAGDLEAIKWAVENHKIYPTKDDAKTAAMGGHLHVIKWIHENVYPENPSCLCIDALEAAVSYGDLDVAKYLRLYVFPEANVKISLQPRFSIERHFETIKWAYECGFSIDCQKSLRREAIMNEDIHFLEWLSINLPANEPISKKAWENAAKNNLHRSYRWLMKNYPNVRQQKGMLSDAYLAHGEGFLEIIKVLHETHPLILQSLSLPSEYVNKKDFHVHNWLAMKGYPVGQI